ncbi:MAG: alpha/beta hydrolase, partial [Firmicutes bacterium]|nr:alpha/beta hydrolase [Bacillota bacterium]
LEDEIAMGSVENYVQSMEQFYSLSNRKVFSQLKQPTLLLVGACDTRTSPAAVDKAQQAIKDSYMLVLPKSGHLAVLDQPDKVAHAVMNFLQGSDSFI